MIYCFYFISNSDNELNGNWAKNRINKINKSNKNHNSISTFDIKDI